METTNVLLISAIVVWLGVFLAIVGRPMVDAKYRRVVIRMPVWKILTIGILWPAVCIGIFLYLVIHLHLFEFLRKPPNNQ